MFIEHNVFIGFRDVGVNNKVTNTALLSYLEDAGGVHSDLAGYGFCDIPNVKKTWVLLGWKIDLYKRPKYGDKITIRTWSSGMEKIYAYRDFEILGENREIIGIATSKWVLIDIEKGKITRLTTEVSDKYEVEDKQVFEKFDLEKLAEPEEFISSTTFKIGRGMIDVNNHLHNIYFMDIAVEALPEEVYQSTDFTKIRMMCKKEIKLGETVKVFYNVENDEHTMTIKSFDEKNLHAIVKLSK